ncbi:MAG: DUF5937 family protein [Lactococcus plantarum]|nr:DUF5937 family protein [Lactococcus plantarum]
MSIKVNFENFTTQSEETLMQRVQFVYSPLNELFRSLHILLNPRHHGLHMKWIVDTQQKMTKALYQELRYFQLFYELGTPTAFLPSREYVITTLDNELLLLEKTLHTMSGKEVAKILTQVSENRESHFIPELAKGIEWGDFQLVDSENIISDILQDAPSVYKRLMQFLTLYKQTIFNPYWEEKHIDRVLLSEIEAASQAMHNFGFSTFINQLQIERIKFQDNQLVILKPFEEQIRFTNADALLFAPSYFTYPHLFAEKFAKGLFITYDCLNRQHKKIDTAQLSKIFFALSDPVRIDIVSYLYEEKNTTQALAQILSYTPSNISKQLKLLKIAGLVVGEKQGKFVFYTPTPLLAKVLPSFKDMVSTEARDS